MPRARLRRWGTRSGAACTVALLVVSGCSGAGGPGDGSTSTVTRPISSAAATTASTAPTTTSATSTTRTPSPATVPPTATLATHLDVPWAVAFLPDGSALVTLRDKAQLLHVRPGHAPTVVGRIAGVQPQGEGGLLGVAVSPRFAIDRAVFVYFTSAEDNRVVRLTYANETVTGPTVVLRGIPKAGHHNGGRLAFGPDGFLYVTTGDAGSPQRAQDKLALGGKILRITADGRPAPGNPFGASPVWTYGHRNVQGIAWAPDGRMFASEFGQDTWDELNLILPGHNYGWPVVEGKGGRPRFTDPLTQWPTSEASPSGIAVADGAVWMSALRGQSLWRIPLAAQGIGTPQRLLQGRYGRLRDAVAGPDGRLWVLTSNTFRGSPRAGDDRLVAFNLATL
ncbi:glucose/arabinose dehydrogenase [Phycicoccus badiiscoriae]|uniref:Glucose/arabinose dehydrogenase n=1 Tax=Pedococcus badiiscoriae TaxID=642776 RepID=A0A852WBI5_9MICO|nr:PQQ-dependent sugar dehydrogenase [Pedococcus badiiscoriae]NYG06010.1 glucose/arabinose dehydrogenase [Pedococcus badiiscoriae]